MWLEDDNDDDTSEDDDEMAAHAAVGEANNHKATAVVVFTGIFMAILFCARYRLFLVAKLNKEINQLHGFGNIWMNGCIVLGSLLW
jgi:hypothetical protein